MPVSILSIRELEADRDRWKALAGRALDVVDLLSPHADMYGTDEQLSLIHI